MRTIALALLGSIAFCTETARAEDPPDSGKAKEPPRWTLEGGAFGMDVSRDGRWVVCRTLEGVRLYATLGGAPVPLDCGKDERLAHYVAFSPDSKFVCVAGQASGAVVKGLPEDKTQSVFIFQVAAPSKPRKIELALKAEGLSSDVKKLMDPKLRGMKMLSGEVRRFTPFAGSRVIFDRGELGLVLWDLASESKFACPPAIGSDYECGIAADGSRCVRLTPKAMEVRDVKSNRVLQSVPWTQVPKKGTVMWQPEFSPDGSRVVLQRRSMDLDAKSAAESNPSEYALECWSLAEGKRVWEASSGSAKLDAGPFVTSSFALLRLDEHVVVHDLRDGAKTDCDLAAAKVDEIRLTAEGEAVWVVTKEDHVLTRMALPAPAEK